MARLPSQNYLIQEIDGKVVLFQDYTERVIVQFDPTSADSAAKAQKLIYDSELSDEDKSFAHFWSGYYYAHLGDKLSNG